MKTLLLVLHLFSHFGDVHIFYARNHAGVTMEKVTFTQKSSVTIILACSMGPFLTGIAHYKIFVHILPLMDTLPATSTVRIPFLIICEGPQGR